jgi:hypothetical protein
MRKLESLCQNLIEKVKRLVLYQLLCGFLFLTSFTRIMGNSGSREVRQWIDWKVASARRGGIIFVIFVATHKRAYAVD